MKYCGLAILVLFATSTLQAQPPQLFSQPDVVVEVDAEKLLQPRMFSRAKLLTLNIQQLLATTDRADFELSAFDIDRKMCSLTPMPSVSESSRSWHGIFDGGYITLVLRTGAIQSGNQISRQYVAAGTIQTSKAVYQIRQAVGEQVIVRELDLNSLPVELEPLVPDEKMEPATAQDAATAPHQFTVAVFYTSKARDGEGGTSQMNAVIDLAVTETNVAYTNSRINATLSLVHREMTNDDESGSFNGMLTALRNSSDGRMDEVHTRRNTHSADLVSLICDDATSCGLAYRMQTLSSTFEGWAFSVINRNCATGYYSFAHELGHNMGCCHDAANPSADPIYPYAYGWHFNVGLSGEEVRTIMAYAPGLRIQYFSNPNVSIGIYPTGKAGEANNALTINNTAGTVAAFR